MYSAANLKDPLNPEWDADEAMVEYLDTIRQYQPDGFRETNAIVGYGYTQAAVFVEALAGGRGADPARAAWRRCTTSTSATSACCCRA